MIPNILWLLVFLGFVYQYIILARHSLETRSIEFNHHCMNQVMEGSYECEVCNP